MVPARNLQLGRRHCDAHGASFPSGIDVTARPTVPGPLTRAGPSAMAQDPLNHQQEPPKPPQDAYQEHDDHRGQPDQEVGTSGGGCGGHKDWLQLGLGPSPATAVHGGDPRRGVVQPAAAAPGAPELELSTDRPPPQPQMLGMPPVAFLRPAIAGIPPASVPVPVSCAGPPWLPQWPHGPPPLPLPLAHRAFYGGAQAGSSGFEMIRVVYPPPIQAAAAGIWFVLRAAENQGREPFLPQIPRSYLRIKDERVTVRLMIKYLANKLGLEDESEVEITCRGRPLPPFLTLQHVRDSIWCRRDAVSVSAPPDMSTANHIMVLQYGRRP